MGCSEDEDEAGGSSSKVKVNGHHDNGHEDDPEQEARTRAIVSQETASVLAGLGPGPLDVRIRRLADERDDLQVRKGSRLL